jgi:benzoyl-CoA reductase/2-hydroxyglutaryl-CoA dehydratase subunit BcrC/BadD/HgdB
MFTPEIRLILLNQGIPVLAFEHNMADRREFDEVQVMARLDAFMESLGLKQLGD